MSAIPLNQLTVGIKGAGEMASAVAWRLYQANLRRIFMMEIPQPIAVRREVSFCEAVYQGSRRVEDVEALLIGHLSEIKQVWLENKIAVLVDPKWQSVSKMRPHVVVDGILAKKNLGTRLSEAPLVIGLGPGFRAGQDVHMLIETNRGHNLGRIIVSGAAEPNTGVPGSIGGFSEQRVLRTSVAGVFKSVRAIGDQVKSGDVVGRVEGVEVRAEIDGVLRG